jgi:hypothetical protein
MEIMETADSDLIKHREIPFAALHPDPNQAATAALALADVPGVMSAHPESPVLLRISYEVLQISLQQIEEALTEAGFHISGGLLYKLKRALYYYTEETQRANNGCPRGDSNCTRRIFISQYSRHKHGCRDSRPEHWRKYL